jgi:hypothetical protein
MAMIYEGAERFADPFRVCAIIEQFPFNQEEAKIKDLPARCVFLLVHGIFIQRHRKKMAE